MALSQWINGEAAIWTGTGSEGALQELGVCVDGVTVSIEILWKDVYIDTYGSQMAFDKIWQGVKVTAKTKLAYWDPTVLSVVQQKSIWNNATLGTLGSVGTFAVQGGMAIRMLIKSPKFSNPLNFPEAILVETDDQNLSATERLEHDLTWQFMPSQQLGDTLNALFYNNTNS